MKGGVVVTVMSNLGFFKAMKGLGIGYEVTPIGDRHVAEAMARLGVALGGEQSGHVILSEYATTGDGLVTALAVLDVMARSGKPLSELAEVMVRYPQVLINVPVEDRAELGWLERQVEARPVEVPVRAPAAGVRHPVS